MLSTLADDGKQFNADVSQIFTSELITLQVFTSDSVEVFVEVVVSHAFEVVSSGFAKKELENNRKLKLMMYHKFLL